MANHKKGDLLDVVESAIIENGGLISNLDKSKHPFVFDLQIGTVVHNIKLYIWKVTHGGGSKRPTDEYRIQITGVTNFSKDTPDQLVLILGWYEELEVFVAFDYNKHSGIIGKSPSMQIKEIAINKAVIHGLANIDKGNGEIVVAFTPPFFIKYLNSLIDPEDIEDENESEIINYRYSISSYGADYPIDSIVKRMEKEVIFIPPFQRQFVWSVQQASRFIESLLLGLPVPGVFLAKEESTGRLLIIDGQQRLTSLLYFYNGFFKGGSKFKLSGVQDDLIGKTYQDLDIVDRTRLDDSIIHATIIKQTQPDDGDSSVYLIFERLNTGGSKLTSQEIRACIYYGEFNETLNSLIENKNWREVFGRPNTRLKEQELILRFFALYYSYESYEKPLKIFLNSFMESNRNNKKYNKEKLTSLFNSTILFINNALKEKAFRIGAGINAAVFDSIMVATAKRLEKGRIEDQNQYKIQYYKLINEPSFLQLIRGGTSDESNLKARINQAIIQFEKID